VGGDPVRRCRERDGGRNPLQPGDRVIRWLKRLFGRRDAFGYRPTERDIFRYYDGRRERRGDPLAIQRALVLDPEFELAIDPGIATVPTPEGIRAAGRTVAAVRRAFGIPAFEEYGLTDAGCLVLFAEFGEFVKGLREAAGPLASSPGPTPASGSADSPTANSAASGFPETVVTADL
jgi:hypothetical protein